MNLTYEDYNFLLEALEAKRKEAGQDGMMSGMLGMMFSKGEEEAQSQFETKMDEAKEKGKLIEERVILLKAKLITMRDQEMVANIDTKGAR